MTKYLKAKLDITVNPSAMFDIQIKRIHEYKRQLMNILEVVAAWNEIKRDPSAPFAPRVRIFGGKAAPGYAMAKLVIKLVNAIGNVVNNDPEVSKYLKVVEV